MKILNASMIRMEGADAMTSVYRLRFSPIATRDQHSSSVDAERLLRSIKSCMKMAHARSRLIKTLKSLPPDSARET